MEQNKLKVVSIRLVEEPPIFSKRKIQNPEEAVEELRDFLQGYDREFFCVLNLKTKGQIINLNIVGMGTLDATLIHPREVFKSAILSNAASVILLHNHPSGCPEPSNADFAVTKRLAAAGQLLGIQVLDHVIVAEEGIYSFRENQQMEEYLQQAEYAAENSAFPYMAKKQEHWR